MAVARRAELVDELHQLGQCALLLPLIPRFIEHHYRPVIECGRKAPAPVRWATESSLHCMEYRISMPEETVRTHALRRAVSHATTVESATKIRQVIGARDGECQVRRAAVLFRHPGTANV